MADAAAPAARSVQLHDDVPDLAGGAVRAAQRAAVEDHAAADAGRDGDVDRVARSLRRAEAPLGHDGHVGVALEEGRHAQRVPEAVGDGDVRPAVEVRRHEDHAAPGVERPGRRDAETDRRRQALVGGVAPDRVGHVGDAAENRVDALLVAGRLGAASVNDEVGCDKGRADLRSAEVDREDRPSGFVLHASDCTDRGRRSR
jgi:hypothetical protein